MPDGRFYAAPDDTIATLERRIRDLQATLAHVRAVADQERRRADAAERSARTAWRLATWAGQRPHDGA